MKSIGILREVYSKWERRSPLAPKHVSELVKNQNIQVVVQPSMRRVFRDEEFRAAGATLSDDLSGCDCIIGVKQALEQEMISGKTYLFFSHTIKAQESNMSLLDTCLNNDIRLLDHEVIKENGVRLVAFGEYAGKAGMLDTFRGLGLRLLGLGNSSPFLHLAPTYCYNSLDEAMATTAQCLEEYGKQGGSQVYALNKDKPMLITFTGNGKVTQGAMQVFNKLPNTQMLQSLDELDELGSMRKDTIFGICVQDCDVIRDENGAFDKQEYRDKPHQYNVHKFAEQVLPVTDILCMGCYWDQRYPRWIPNTPLVREKAANLLMISDLSCDTEGSFEGLRRTSTIESPFYYVRFDKTMDEIGHPNLNEMDPNNKLVLAVDILPSELPREASNHFGDCLFPFLSHLCEEQLPPILQDATICQKGSLMPKFAYIDKMRGERARSASIEVDERTVVIQLTGHLFDTGLINEILDLIERMGLKFSIELATLIKSQELGDSRLISNRARTLVVLQVAAPAGEVFNQKRSLDDIVTMLRTLVHETPQAQATLSVVDALEGEVSVPFEQDPLDFSSFESGTVLVLGSGMVSAPAIEYLLHETNVPVSVISNSREELMSLNDRFEGNRLRLIEHVNGLDLDRVADSIFDDSVACVLSLLPASMHASVAEKICIPKRLPLVTASYVGTMRDRFHKTFQELGIPMLCEMGLDPGMDHMSCAKVIEEGGGGAEVVSFQSVCGGLPAPDCADNVLGYKLSWSPMGMLLALKNPSRFISGHEVQHCENILHAAEPFALANGRYPSLNLQLIPNRDSLTYAEPYGIPLSNSIERFFRGTLRYEGFCEVMADFHASGWLDNASPFHVSAGMTWGDVLNKETFGERAWSYVEPELDKELNPKSESRLEALCGLIGTTLRMQPQDRDMTLMEHRIKFRSGQQVHSSLILFGDSKYSAMSRTVGVTAAIGVQILLTRAKELNKAGVFDPTSKWVYDDALQLLSEHGIHFSEQIIN